jgi:hypothetical protein
LTVTGLSVALMPAVVTCTARATIPLGEWTVAAVGIMDAEGVGPAIHQTGMRDNEPVYAGGMRT